MNSNGSFHRSTDRILSILEYLTETENIGKSLTEIAVQLGAPKSSILPMLRTMTSRGYLHYNALTQQYFIGYKIYEIGTKYVSDAGLNDAIYQLMLDVALKHDITLSLAELVAGDVLFLQRVDPFEKLRIYRAVGRRLPAYSTAHGKCLLSEKTPQEVEQLYPDGLSPLTPKTITNFDVLFEQLALCRQRGFSVSDEEATMYVRSFGIPIRKNSIIAYGLEASLSVLDCDEKKEREVIFAIRDCRNRIELILKNQ